jgi:glycosyltransferase involved in cell wall biosynthesis
MKVSVVIPAYNEEKYIRKCLDSLMKQSEKADEIIVVDNNSQDSTIAVARKYQGVKIIQEKIQGTTPTRNRGFNEAKEEIIARCDADSVLPSNWIKEIKIAFKKNKIVGFTSSFVFYDLSMINRSFLPSNIFYFNSKLILGFYSLVGPAMAIRKTVWNKVKDEVCLDDKKVHEDLDLSIHIKKYGDIVLNKKVVIKMSGRRMKNDPLSFFVEYPLRFTKMMKIHRELIKAFIKKVSLTLSK